MCETAKPETTDAIFETAARARDPREALNRQAADKVRAAANAQEAGREATAGLYFGDDARRPRLRERVNNSLHHSQRAADRLQKLGELEYLLAKNPDVARILELVEETRV